MSDLEFKATSKFFQVTISSIKYTKNTNSDIISLQVNNNSVYKMTLPLGLLGYCETNAIISPTTEIAYTVNNILKFFVISKSTTLNEELSNNNIISEKNATQTVLQNYLILNQHFRYQNIPLKKKSSLQGSTFNTLKLHKKNLNN